MQMRAIKAELTTQRNEHWYLHQSTEQDSSNNEEKQLANTLYLTISTRISLILITYDMNGWVRFIGVFVKTWQYRA